MRIASRVVGVVLALTGLGFIILPGYVYALGQLPLDIASDWRLIAVLVGIGIGCLLVGRYFLKLKFDESGEAERQPESRPSVYLRGHRQELKIVAAIGLLISLIRFAVVCFGMKWPGWVSSPLSLASIAMMMIATLMVRSPARGDMDRQEVPSGSRLVLRIAWNATAAAILACGALFAWNQWRYEAPSAVLQAGFPVVLFLYGLLAFVEGRAASA